MGGTVLTLCFFLCLEFSWRNSSGTLILVHPTRRQSFAGKLHSTFCNIWDLVISRNTKNSNLTGLYSDVNGYSWSDIAWEIICDVATEVKSTVTTKIYFHPHPTHQYTLNRVAIKTSKDCNIEYLMLQVIKKQEEEKEAEEKKDVVKVMREYWTLLRPWCSFSFETGVTLSDVLHRIFFTLFYSDLFFTSNDDDDDDIDLRALTVTLVFAGDGEATRGEFATKEILLRQNGILHFITFANNNFSKR